MKDVGVFVLKKRDRISLSRIYLPWSMHTEDDGFEVDDALYCSAPGGEYILAKAIEQRDEGRVFWIKECTNFMDYHGFEMNDVVLCEPHDDPISRWKAVTRLRWPCSNHFHPKSPKRS
jgi:hypothetical protein